MIQTKWLKNESPGGVEIRMSPSTPSPSPVILIHDLMGPNIKVGCGLPHPLSLSCSPVLFPCPVLLPLSSSPPLPPYIIHRSAEETSKLRTSQFKPTSPPCRRTDCPDNPSSPCLTCFNSVAKLYMWPCVGCVWAARGHVSRYKRSVHWFTGPADTSHW